ncbi:MULTISPECIES: hypothetical protein [unclassified Streptomyces]|uniref:hypothetical protein n=1 Tax=unclassified Streptomyces TaxID=2593676 RepID=UPI002DDAE15B|nr:MULTISPECIES: hypothetical protein [unclassified Streptomyces]WSA96656.1 hypothetical protein OIE63_37720 [Streptomyces sp. NBC_01795]WSB81071.1 hypothetical protein OHB04_38840 [Streptomyces sp. NBC_01775]WSS10719.1 hypothetical protein OG533_01420 [Streptomyces sp. NBC_01186]WSS39414.1 hypothetical protein OG220_01445 [Streptomyces sp. NBC_01187]
MPEFPGGRTTAAPAPEGAAATGASRQQRLAELLADMVPGARTIRVSQREPDRNWPTPNARAYDGQGRLLTLNRAQRLTAARWVIRASPELDWDEPHDLDLASGTLRPTAEGYGAVVGGC